MHAKGFLGKDQRTNVSQASGASGEVAAQMSIVLTLLQYLTAYSFANIDAIGVNVTSVSHRIQLRKDCADAICVNVISFLVLGCWHHFL